MRKQQPKGKDACPFPPRRGHSEILRRVASAPISPGQLRLPLLGSAALCSKSQYNGQSELSAPAGFQRCKVPNLHGERLRKQAHGKGQNCLSVAFLPRPSFGKGPVESHPKMVRQTQRKKSGRQPPTIRRFERTSGCKAYAATLRRLSDAKCSQTDMMLLRTEAGFSKRSFSIG